jgi:flagellar biosynthesis/type III secretory pathway chaperone
MKSTIMQLMALLDDEAACYRQMQDLLVWEKESVSLSKKERFDQVEQDKESLVAKIQACEKQRAALVDQLAAHYGMDAPVVTVRVLAQYLNASDGERLLARADRLRALVADVQSKNRHNQRLIGLYLNLIKGSLKLLMPTADDHAVYSKSGSARPANGYRSSGGRLFCSSV